MLTNWRKFEAFWAPRIGPEAARLRWDQARLLALAGVLNIVWFASIGVGVRLDLPVLTGVGGGVALAAAACLALAVGRLRAANRAASRRLGIKLGFRAIAPPPRSADRYEAWCRKHGIRPYTADPP